VFERGLLKTSKGYFYDPVKSLWSFSLQPEEEEENYLIFEIPKDQKGVAVYLEFDGLEGEERILQLQ